MTFTATVTSFSGHQFTADIVTDTMQEAAEMVEIVMCEGDIVTIEECRS